MLGPSALLKIKQWDDLGPLALMNVPGEVTKYPPEPDKFRVTLRTEIFC